MPSAQGLLLVISGPAGVGKDTVWQAARPCLPSFAKAVTCTTRPRREGEVEGVHYYFVSEEQFDQLIHEGRLLEWAHVHNHRYGLPAHSLLDRLNNGQDVTCVIDVQGAQRVKVLFPAAILVFIKPPAGEEVATLRERMDKRGDCDSEKQTRIETAVWELSQTRLYDYQVVNDDVDKAARRLCELVEQERTQRQPARTDCATG